MNDSASSKTILTRLRNRAAVFTIILILAITAGYVYSSDWEYKFFTGRIERIIEKKNRDLKRVISNLHDNGIAGQSLRNSSQRDRIDNLRKEGMTILVYADSSLVFWSDNSFDVPFTPFIRETDDKLLFLQNGYFLYDQFAFSDTIIVGLLRVYNSFEIENELLKNGFPEYFRSPLKAGIGISALVPGYKVRDSDGSFLFLVQYPEEKDNTMFIIIPVLLWCALLLFLLLVIDDLVLLIILRSKPRIAILFKTLIFSGFLIALYQQLLPEVLMRTEVFKGTVFSIGRVIPSMGHLFLLSILLADLFRTIFLFFPVREQGDQNMSRLFIRFTGALLPGTIMAILFHQLLNAIVRHTNVNFEGFRVDELSLLSLIGITSLFLMMMGIGFYLLKVVRIYRPLKLLPFLLGTAINLLIFVDVGLLGIATSWPLALYFLLLVVLLRLHSEGTLSTFNLSALFSIILALYLTTYITRISRENELENLKVMAVSYGTEHDPVAEYLLLDLDKSLKSDTTLQKMMKKKTFGDNEVVEVSDYLFDTYFGDYWTNYNFSMVMCDENSSLRVNEENTIVSDCFMFFEDRIRNEGEAITGTNFHFLNKRTGRPCYLATFYYDLPEGGRNGLFIELVSFINSFREGYPELLSDQKYLSNPRKKEYSFAKYIDGKLVLNTGDFRYWTNDRDFAGESGSYFSFVRDGYSHLLYRTGDTAVILSRPVIPFLSIIVSFAWIFTYLIVLTTLLSLLYRKVPGKSIFRLNFRQKLQWAFAIVILLSLVGTASGAVWLSYEQYRSNHFNKLREKVRSVTIELEQKLGDVTDIDNGWSDGNYQSLDELLVKFSNVFYTDINLYDKGGILLATSRPEIFIRDITSIRMDNLAHISVSQLTENEYISVEKTGSLAYLSIYVPFYNNRNEMLAYLNLPYFSMQSALSTEISNLIVAIINFSILLILATLSIAVLLSDRITAPIRMIGNVLSSVKLGKKSEHLSYSSDDEIGDLVRHYNAMIEELEESTKKLAESEREFAWREMARQIAHEIKNPLTPMKLNIQQLEKSWKDGKPAFGKKIEKFTVNQIEYIDNLSTIATAFSNFARLPNANPVELDIVETLKTTLELFRNSGNVTFRINCPNCGKIVVSADREQMNSIFSNLIKNSIQAIPPDTAGIIKLGIGVEKDRVIITISDNGIGIPEEERSRLFTPYFTTKSSGSGLGLGIVKRFVEGMGGVISFISDTQNGTTFTISLPVLYSVERP